MKTLYELVIRPGEINFAPTTLIEEVMQNIITICTTHKFSVPMDREFGVNATFLDEPVNESRAKYSAEIVKAVRKFEPRARVTHITYEGDLEGHVWPHIKFRLIDES